MTERLPTSEPEYQLTRDERHNYEGFWRHPAVCRIRIFERSDAIPVVIATELAENTGTSITNMAEYLAAEIVSHHFPERFETEEPVIWVEQYPRHPGQCDLPEFSQVVFASYTPHIVWAGMRQRIRLGQPSWRYLEREEVERLVGPVAMEVEE